MAYQLRPVFMACLDISVRGWTEGKLRFELDKLGQAVLEDEIEASDECGRSHADAQYQQGEAVELGLGRPFDGFEFRNGAGDVGGDLVHVEMVRKKRAAGVDYRVKIARLKGKW